MSIARLIRDMADAGATPEAIAIAVEAIEAAGAKDAERKARRAEQKRQERERRATVARQGVDSRSQKQVSPHTPLQEKQSPPSPPLGGSSPTAGRRLPDDFEPDMQAATAEGLSMPEAQREADKFRDYWRSQAGQRGRKADWPATWRNWCRRAGEDRAKARGSPGKPKSKSVGDMFADQARQMMNGYHDEPANKPDRHITQGDTSRHDSRLGQLIDTSLKSGW